MSPKKDDIDERTPEQREADARREALENIAETEQAMADGELANPAAAPAAADLITDEEREELGEPKPASSLFDAYTDADTLPNARPRQPVRNDNPGPATPDTAKDAAGSGDAQQAPPAPAEDAQPKPSPKK